MDTLGRSSSSFERRLPSRVSVASPLRISILRVTGGIMGRSRNGDDFSKDARKLIMSFFFKLWSDESKCLSKVFSSCLVSFQVCWGESAGISTLHQPAWNLNLGQLQAGSCHVGTLYTPSSHNMQLPIGHIYP